MYFAIIADAGIVVRQAESRAELQYPNDWQEVPNIHEHANERGLHSLSQGKRMIFTQHDQSWRSLMDFFQ